MPLYRNTFTYLNIIEIKILCVLSFSLIFVILRLSLVSYYTPLYVKFSRNLVFSSHFFVKRLCHPVILRIDVQCNISLERGDGIVFLIK